MREDEGGGAPLGSWIMGSCAKMGLEEAGHVGSWDVVGCRDGRRVACECVAVALRECAVRWPDSATDARRRRWRGAAVDARQRPHMPHASDPLTREACGVSNACRRRREGARRQRRAAPGARPLLHPRTSSVALTSALNRACGPGPGPGPANSAGWVAVSRRRLYVPRPREARRGEARGGLAPSVARVLTAMPGRGGWGSRCGPGRRRRRGCSSR